MGCTVITAGNVADAMAAASERRFDVLICDIGLPDGTGLEFLRQFPADTLPPAIALSGFGMEEDHKKSLDAGFVAHLTKPVDLHLLEETLHRHVLR
jgi:CheY-like chemotaxis protein